MFFLDTATCIDFLSGNSESVRARLLATPPGEIAVPAVVKAELLLGVYKSKRKVSNQEKLERFLKPFEIVPLSDPACYVYADLLSRIPADGTLLRPGELQVAAIVRHHDGILVTSNVAGFSQVGGLRIEDWRV